MYDESKLELYKALLSSAEHCISVQQIVEIISIVDFSIRNELGEDNHTLRELVLQCKGYGYDKIKIIKVVREKTEELGYPKAGLKDTKDFVESIMGQIKEGDLYYKNKLV